jgi:hypothetical protein
MKKISLNNILQQRDLMKREYCDYDLQYLEYKRTYFNQLYLEYLWMWPLYINFNDLFDKYQEKPVHNAELIEEVDTYNENYYKYNHRLQYLTSYTNLVYDILI